ncbi:hypothetical protein [Ekhidna sp.]|uniref:hypothetical protein n=1 Tax=Ekhidna sp. TaxID=2608089 RepID=UPI0032EBDBC7
MQEFQLTIFRQSRILLVIFTMPMMVLSAFFSILFLRAIHPLNWIIGISIIALVGISLFYISIGRLTVKVENQTLKFDWHNKLLFNYKPIEPVQLGDIRTLVINEQTLLKELQTDQRQIPIGTAKLLKKDATEFINFLQTHTTAEQIDSWEVWKRRGWLAIAYRINTFILVILGLIMIPYISFNGFDKTLLLYIPLILFQLLGYQLVMKSKM